MYAYPSLERPLNRRLSMVRVRARTSWRARAPRRPLATGVDANVAVDGAAKTALFSFEISTVHPWCDVFHPRSPSSWVINGRLERKKPSYGNWFSTVQ